MAAAAPLAAAAIPAFEGLGMIGAAAAPAMAAAAPAAAAGLGAAAPAAAGLAAELAPVYTAGVNTAGLLGPSGTGTVMGTVLPGMNQGASLLTTPFAKLIDTAGPAVQSAGRAWQAGQLLGGQGQPQAQRRPPAMPNMPTGRPREVGRQPTPAEIAAWTRVNARNRNRRTMG